MSNDNESVSEKNNRTETKAAAVPKGTMAMWHINQALQVSCEALAHLLNTPKGEVMGPEVEQARNAWNVIRYLAPVALARSQAELRAAFDADDEDGPWLDPEF